MKQPLHVKAASAYECSSSNCVYIVHLRLFSYPVNFYFSGPKIGMK